MRIGFTRLEIIVISTVLVVLGVILYPVLKQPRCELSASSICLGNQRSIAMNILLYVQDHDEIFPDSAKIWTVINFDEYILYCRADTKLKNGYLYNNNLSGCLSENFDIKQMKTTLLTVDGITKTRPGRKLKNILYAPTDVRYRHGGYAVASFLDGHSERILKITEPESWDKIR